MRIKKRMIASVVAMFVLVMSAIPVSASDVTPKETRDEVSSGGTLISNDLTKKVVVDKKDLAKGQDEGVLAALDEKDTRIEHPKTLLIWSFKATPYAMEKTTGILYNFTDFIIGNSTYYPTNQMVISFTPEQLASWEKTFSDLGYELIGWKMNMTYQPNTLQIPRRLSIRDDSDNEIDYVTLSSTDWNRNRVYSQDFYHFSGGQYYGEIKGHLVATNLDGSAEWYQFKAKMIFN